MEITCKRCHQTIQAENCYCPSCGLPQLLYANDIAPGQAEPERWNEVVRDASEVEWKPALRWCALLAVPAGLLCSGLSPLSGMGLFWMAMAAAWSVSLYMRSQHPAWITTGAGARIGLVTGLLGGWLAIGISGVALFVQRYLLHHASQMDADWKARVEASQQMTLEMFSQMGMGNAAQMQAQKAWMLSPEGHAGMEVFGFIFSAAFFLLCAAAGGALGARMLAGRRKPEV
jgi:hypothetical protein